MSQGRPQDERNAKSARIREILDECARRRSAGEDVPDGDVIASHAELMPELQEALNQLAQPGRTGQDVTVTPTLGDDGSTEGRGTISPPLPGDTFAGYDIIRELSRGGQAAVYQTIQKSTKRKVAVKIPLEGVFASKSVRRRFEREIELVAQLKHPNIISIFDSGQTPDGRPFYVMDYVRGLPLHRYVRERKPTLEETLKLFATVCEAVQYAHQRAIIHRDLKPSNILVDSAGSPKILDFGLAKWIAEPVTTLVSVTRSMVGTLPYMSPEQTRGNPDEIDTRTDVYSLGVVLYEALTGKYPYPVAGEMGDVLRNIAEAPPTPPSRNWSIDSGVTKRASKRLRAGQCPIDGDVETIALRALAKDPARRYQSAGELARDVHHYLAGAPIDAKRDSSWYLLRMALRRYRGLAATAGLFLVLGIAFGIGMARMYVKTTGELVRQRERADAWAGLFGSETGGQARASTEPRIVDVRVDDTDRRTILVKYEGEDPWKAFKQLPPDVDDIDAVALADVDDSGRQLVVASTRLPTGSLIAWDVEGALAWMTHVSAEYVSSPATEIIYVADFSGSIIVAVDDLRRELKRQIDGLDPTEFFNVVVTYGDPTDRKGAVTKAFRPRPELATKEAQRGFCRWIDEQAPRGSTEPVVAMTYALSFKPDRIVLFSDGYFEDEAVDKINRANRGGATQIDCVVFDEVLLEDTSGMPRETRGTRRLRRIAEANNGEVRVLTGADLGR